MPLIRPSKLPPPPELGDKTFWDYFPKRSMRRIFFLLIALGVVIFLQRSGPGSFGGLFDSGRPATAPQQGEGAYFRLQVKPPTNAAPASKSTP
jgi:hypothetical protein